MGLLQRAVETYDYHKKYIGKTEEGHTPLPPISHIMARAQLEITITKNGTFFDARAVAIDEPKIIIPVTEESAGRTKNPCPHPLCDNLGYLAPLDMIKHGLYVTQLTEWTKSCFSHPKLLPILKYVKNGAILMDLADRGLINLNANGAPADEKLLVRWRVTGLGDDSKASCWDDVELFESFIGYYTEKLNQEQKQLCMITGEIAQSAKQHQKGIIPIHGNAKLISSNDRKGFTYRGRISEDWQAATISYEASQKVHIALRWLAAEQGTRGGCGNRTFLCWNPQGKEVCHVFGAFAKFGKKIVDPTEYQNALQETLNAYRSQLGETDSVVIAAFDAATTGRLSLTYYNELAGSDYLKRLYDWDQHCCWNTRFYGIHSPSLRQIVDCAFGTQQISNGSASLETDSKVLSQQIQRLIFCKVDREKMPADIYRALVKRASTPHIYKKDIREKILCTACAVVKKWRYDRFNEEWEMVLEPNKRDRSYQFGRLLAIMEVAERSIFRNKDETEYNSIRLHSMFCQRPMATVVNLGKILEKICFSRLKPGRKIFYENLISEILEVISGYPEELNKPLDATYLMGYYLQRSALYKSKGNQIEGNEY